MFKRFRKWLERNKPKIKDLGFDIFYSESEMSDLSDGRENHCKVHFLGNRYGASITIYDKTRHYGLFLCDVEIIDSESKTADQVMWKHYKFKPDIDYSKKFKKFIKTLTDVVRQQQ